MNYIRNFECEETQVLACTGTSAVATFTTDGGKKARDVRIQNIGSNGAWVLPVATSTSVVKNQGGGVAGTRAIYVQPGEDVVLRKPLNAYAPYVAGITDASTTTLVISAGAGS